MADAVETDEAALVPPGERAMVVANLPYNVATPLLIKWLTAREWPPWYDSLTLMFQREVAERIVAAPGDAAYGRLSVISQWRSRAQNPVRRQPQRVHAGAQGDVDRRAVSSSWPRRAARRSRG